MRGAGYTFQQLKDGVYEVIPQPSPGVHAFELYKEIDSSIFRVLSAYQQFETDEFEVREAVIDLNLNWDYNYILQLFGYEDEFDRSNPIDCVHALFSIEEDGYHHIEVEVSHLHPKIAARYIENSWETKVNLSFAE